MKKITFILLLAVGIVKTTNAQKSYFNPKLSILASHAFLDKEQVISSGKFDTERAVIMPGIEFTNEVPLSSSYALNAGLRLSLYQFDVHTAGTEYMQWTWRKNYFSLTVPISVSKKFQYAGRRGDYSVGIAAGILECFAETGHSTLLNPDEVYPVETADAWGPFTPTQRIQGFVSLDLGAHYQPFRKLPRLDLGAMLSYQINNCSSSSYEMVIRELGTGSYNFDMNMTQRFINTSIILRYVLGK